jgi:hypothetical protein
LPLNCKTSVIIEAIGAITNVYFNGTVVGSYADKVPRIVGNADVFLGDPWYLPADAIISNIKIGAATETSYMLPILSEFNI